MAINDDVVSKIHDAAIFAPLHNATSLRSIQSMRELYPAMPQVAVFDTAFHQTMPPRAYRYAIPEKFYQEDHIRRYGFHGNSHK